MPLKPTDPSRAQVELLAKLTKSKCFRLIERKQTENFLKQGATKRSTIQLIDRAKRRIEARDTLKEAIEEEDLPKIRRWLKICEVREVKDQITYGHARQAIQDLEDKGVLEV